MRIAPLLTSTDRLGRAAALGFHCRVQHQTVLKAAPGMSNRKDLFGEGGETMVEAGLENETKEMEMRREIMTREAGGNAGITCTICYRGRPAPLISLPPFIHPSHPFIHPSLHLSIYSLPPILLYLLFRIPSHTRSACPSTVPFTVPHLQLHRINRLHRMVRQPPKLPCYLDIDPTTFTFGLAFPLWSATSIDNKAKREGEREIERANY